MPIEPASTEASSVRMSPNMFSVTTTSSVAGLVTTHRGGDLPPEPRGLEHVGLVDAGDLPLPALREPEGELDHAPHLEVLVLERVHRPLVAVLHVAPLGLAEVEAARELAD